MSIGADSVRTPTRRFGTTDRRDAWWLKPLLTATGLAAFGVYSLAVVATGANYHYAGGGADYLSPFYSPNLDSIFGVSLPFSYAFLVLWVPLGLRATCYYYRKAYYRSFFLSPPACAVSGPARGRYRGERAVQNLHRYFFYLTTIVVGFLWYDAVRSFFFTGSDGSLTFGVGLGSLILLANVIFLSAFTFGCNSLRHLVGGRLDCLSCSRRRAKAWHGVTLLNVRHGQWAWISLASVALADLYVRLAASGVLHDPRIF